MTNIDNSNRAQIRRALIGANVKTAGMDDAALAEKYDALVMAGQLEPVTDSEPKLRKLSTKACGAIWAEMKACNIATKGKSHEWLARWAVAGPSGSTFSASVLLECNEYLLARNIPASLPDLAEDDGEPTPTPTPTPGSAPDGLQGAVTGLVKELGKLQSSSLDEERVVELIEKHSLAPRTTSVEITADDREPVRIEGCHRMVPQLLNWISAGLNVALFGAPGGGKSTATEQVAESLGIEYRFQGTTLHEHKVFGFIDANGTYHRTAFRDAWEHGGVFVAEEFDSWSPKAALALNNLLSGQWGDFPDGMVKRSNKFLCIANMNTTGRGADRQMVGRNPMDAATMDRFTFLEWGYDEALERSIALEINPEAGDWVTLVQQYRAKAEQNKVPVIISPRASINGARALLAGLSMEQMREGLIYKGIPADQRALLEA